MIVPFAPGGVTDAVARPVAEAMGRKLGQPVVVENKVGSGGAVGIAHTARAKPDGYTILMSLPAKARWWYDYHAPPGSREAELTEYWLKPRDWANEL